MMGTNNNKNSGDTRLMITSMGIKQVKYPHNINKKKWFNNKSGFLLDTLLEGGERFIIFQFIYFLSGMRGGRALRKMTESSERTLVKYAWNVH